MPEDDTTPQPTEQPPSRRLIPEHPAGAPAVNRGSAVDNDRLASLREKWAETQRVAPNTYANTMSSAPPGLLPPAPGPSQNATAQVVEATVAGGQRVNDEDGTGVAPDATLAMIDAEIARAEGRDKTYWQARRQVEEYQASQPNEAARLEDVEARMLQGGVRDRQATVRESLSLKMSQIRAREEGR